MRTEPIKSKVPKVTASSRGSLQSPGEVPEAEAQRTAGIDKSGPLPEPEAAPQKARYVGGRDIV